MMVLAVVPYMLCMALRAYNFQIARVNTRLLRFRDDA